MRSSTPVPQPMPLPRRKRPRRPAEQPNHERWLVSYADFITLMFAFFTIMYAISTVDAEKLKSMEASIGEAFEPTASGEGEGTRILFGKEPAPELSMGAGPGGEVGLAVLQKQVTEQLAEAIAEKRIDIELDDRGLVISIREAGSFQAGSAVLAAEARTLLYEIGSILSRVGNQVRIEGHTDDIPIHTPRFASNWELSTTRATNVVAFLLERANIRPEQLSVAGYGKYRPKVANSSDANRARNRRVDLVILNPTEPT